MSNIVDARGLSCPQPVLLTLSALRDAKKGDIIILVDTDTARENVVRAANGKGWTVKKVDPEGAEYKITINRK